MASVLNEGRLQVLCRIASGPTGWTLGPIRLQEWHWLVVQGWESDGSSCSLDDIEGVRIGRSGAAFADADLPANRHDFFYALGRLLLQRHRDSAAFRKAADAGYRDDCARCVAAALIGWRVTAGALRARARYVALRLFGHGAWRG